MLQEEGAFGSPSPGTQGMVNLSVLLLFLVGLMMSLPPAISTMQTVWRGVSLKSRKHGIEEIDKKTK
jgi:hypothetical protein